MTQPKKRILIVGRDRDLMTQLEDVLSNDYLIVQSPSFEDALSEILLGEFQMIITESKLPDLSGMDLLSVVAGLRPGTPVMIIDDQLSAKNAISAMRLGACDYLHKPINLQLLLMQIERQFDLQRRTQQAAAAQAVTSGENGKLPESLPTRNLPTHNGERPATLLLTRQQFQHINMELTTLLNHIRAHFVGLIDAEGNLAGAAGILEDYDLVLLTRALSIDHTATSSLAQMLDEGQFQAAYLEGTSSGVYIVEIRVPYMMSLALICSTEVKPGMVWLYAKRTAENIASFLASSKPAETSVSPMQITN